MKASTIIDTIYKIAEEQEDIDFPTLQEILLMLDGTPSEAEMMARGSVAPKRLTNDRRQKAMLG